jgi:hypothetical protein
MAALEEDVEMQKRGVVIVMYRYHFDGHQSVDRLLTSLNLINALPWKPMAIHYCSSEEMMMNILQPMKNIVLMMIGPEGRKRYRSHHGKKTWIFEEDSVDSYAIYCQEHSDTCTNALLLNRIPPVIS